MKLFIILILGGISFLDLAGVVDVPTLASATIFAALCLMLADNLKGRRGDRG
jgi:hypothetical protein